MAINKIIHLSTNIKIKILEKAKIIIRVKQDLFQILK